MFGWTIPSRASEITVSTNSVGKPWLKLLFKTLGNSFSLPNPEDADLDDGVINLVDFALLAENWLKDEVVLLGDLNWNNRINLEDLSIMTSEWLE